jgi:HEAT repeat protein
MDSDDANMKFPSQNASSRRKRLFRLAHLSLVGILLLVSGPLIADPVEDTVNRALDDLESGQSEIRRGAAMLLGKYPAHRAMVPALLGLLDDPHEGVRRAAVVSLAEHAARLQGAEARKLLGSLLDPDPEVRLGVAAFLPQLMLQATRVRNRDQATVVISGTDRDTLQEALLAALHDPLPDIRIQALEALRFIPWRLPPEPLAEILDDPESEVRLTAYPVLLNRLNPLDFTAAALEAWPEPNRAVRLVLAESLVRQPPAAEYGALLGELAEDDDPAIRQLAAAGRFILSPRKGFEPGLAEALRKRDFEAALVFRIFNALRTLPVPEATALATLLLDAESVLVRSQATRLWLQFAGSSPDPDRLAAILRDPAPEVRQEALRFLASRPEAITLEKLLPLADSPYVDVRLQALGLSRALPPEAAMRFALRMLMDTEPEIRRGALDQLASLKPDNWERLFRASMRDPSPLVQRAAVAHLIQRFGDAGRRLARDYARANPDQAIVSIIRTEFSRLPPEERVPPPPSQP